MKTKTILPLAMILALPITANATGPAAYSGNSPTVATASAPYQTVTPEAHADEHIASTQYVIGAYNDAIAAVNKVANDKQNKLVSENGQQPIQSDVFGAAFGDDVVRYMTNSAAVSELYEDSGLNTSLLSTAGVIGVINGMLTTQVVPIYTTWNDDSATTGVNLMHTDNL